MKLFYLTLGLLLAFVACQKDEPSPNALKTPLDHESTVAREWFELECTIVKSTSGFFPPQAARAFAYTGIALYESQAPGWPGAKSLAGQITGLQDVHTPHFENGQEYHWGLVANATLAQMMRLLFEKTIKQEDLTKINELEQKWNNQLNISLMPNVFERSVAFGKAIATGIFEYSKTDGGHEAYVDPFQLPYTWPAINGAWKPTGATPNPLSPRWGSNRLMIPENSIEGQPLAHTPYSTDPSSEFFKEALQVYEVVQNRTAEQVEIAKFWADDPFNTCTPAGHTFNILTQLLEENDASLGWAAVAYAQLGIAENDAFICCWKTKYDYFLIRPVTYIRENIDPAFNTVIGTPPFPAYTSGHATEAAVGSRIFTHHFTNGDGYYPFTDRTQIQFGFSVRNYNNFDEMAAECADSRLYGGIHFNFDNLNGLKMGKSIGDNAIKKIRWPSVQ